MWCQEHFWRGWEILHTSISTSFLKIRISSFTDELINKRNDIISKYAVPHTRSEALAWECSDAHLYKHIHPCTYIKMYTYMHTKHITCPHTYICAYTEMFTHLMHVIANTRSHRLSLEIICITCIHGHGNTRFS